MNIVYLIGNGFDLNLGLKTKYSDFIKEYIIPKTEDNLQIAKFKGDIAQSEQNWSSAELEFGKYTSRFFGEDGREYFLNCHEDFCRALSILN